MIAYVVRRLIQAVIVLVVLMTVVFFAMRFLPGDPVLIYMTQQQMSVATKAEMEAMRHDLGLDRPLYVQYFDWASKTLQGDLGKSIIKRKTVSDILVDAIPISLHLGILSFILSIIIAVPIGVVCAVRRGKWIDSVLTVLANIGITAPIFWVGIMLIYIFSIWLHWLPTYGYTYPTDDFWLSTKKLLMPVFCLTLFPLAATVRQTRSAMLEVIQQDYIRTAFSKGLKERVIIFRHALKNGILPVVTMAGMGFSFIIGGQVLIETVFGIPGMGRIAVDALFNRDYPVIQGVILIVACVVVITNLIVDISYGWLDPRVKYD